MSSASQRVAWWLALALVATALISWRVPAGTQTAGSSATPGPQGGSMSDFTKPSDDELRQRLSPLQYKVTQQEGTERPFENELWDEKRPGIYVDVVSGEPLFSSLDKYDSGTGWPSFSKPLDAASLVTREDRKLGMARTEVRSKGAGSHLGHVFDDGPGPSGLRYCMNSAALRFVPVERLEAEGYGRFLPLFTGGGKSQEKDSGKRETAILAGGCFWGMEDLLRAEPGVVDTEVGYTGGATPNPGYDAVHAGTTGHAEAVRVIFDPERTSYEKILLFFFRVHDPTTLNRQGNDIGTSYRSAIFYLNEEQRRIAEAVKARVAGSGAWKRPIVTEITAASDFWPAEDRHQDYLKKHPGGYTCHFERDLAF